MGSFHQGGRVCFLWKRHGSSCVGIHSAWYVIRKGLPYKTTPRPHFAANCATFSVCLKMLTRVFQQPNRLLAKMERPSTSSNNANLPASSDRDDNTLPWLWADRETVDFVEIASLCLLIIFGTILNALAFARLVRYSRYAWHLNLLIPFLPPARLAKEATSNRCWRAISTWILLRYSNSTWRWRTLLFC